MSIKKWQEIARQKEVENQRDNILNPFKERKVADEMGSMKAEKLFRPITKKLDPAKKEEPEREDFYGNLDRDLWDEGDLEVEMQNMFDDGQNLLPQDEGVTPKFVKNIPLPDKDDFELEDILPDSEDEVLPGEKPRRHSAPSLSEPPAYSPPPSYKFQKKDPESVDLSTLEKFLKNNKGDPNAKFETKKSKFFGWNKTQVEDEVFRIYAERAKKALQKKSIGQKKMGPFTGKSRKEIRNMLGMEGKNPEDIKQMPLFTKDSEQDIKSMIGTGWHSLITRLSLGIASIFAGNSSLKLRKEIQSIADILFQNGVLSKEQRKKISFLKCVFKLFWIRNLQNCKIQTKNHMISRFALILQSFWTETKITKSLWIKFIPCHILGIISERFMGIIL